jgi:hypothetical protein
MREGVQLYLYCSLRELDKLNRAMLRGTMLPVDRVERHQCNPIYQNGHSSQPLLSRQIAVEHQLEVLRDLVHASDKVLPSRFRGAVLNRAVQTLPDD